MAEIINPDVAWAARQFTDPRQERYHLYHQYVSGVQPISFATGRFEDAFGKKFEKFAYNRTDSIVAAIADRLQVIGFAADASDAKIADKAQHIWDDNSLDLHEDDLEEECLTSGDSYAIVEQDINDPSRVLIWPQYARNMRVRYSTERPGEIEMAARQWIDGHGENRRVRLNLYYRDKIEKYRSTNAGSMVVIDGNTQWERYQPEGDRNWPVELNVTDTVPVFHFANKARINGYGVSELASVIPIQDALNKAVMDLLVGMEFSAFRQRVLLNVDLEEQGAEERIDQLEVGITRLLSIVGEPDGPNPGIAEFSATDVRQFIGPIDLFDTLISRVAKVPVHYLQLSGDFPSGEALRTAEAPFVAKVERLQRRMGDGFNRMMTYAVRLSGNHGLKPGVLETKWSSAMPLSDSETLDYALKRQSLGIPLTTNLQEMGKDSDYIAEVMAAIDEENERKLRMFNSGNIDAYPMIGRQAAPSTGNQ